MSESLSIYLPDAEATEALGATLADAIRASKLRDLQVWLHGDLGAGKSSLVRAVIRGLGYSGRVPSPTYTLLEPYEVAGMQLLHLDLYRLSDPGELEFLGLRDESAQLVFIEWPERAENELRQPDLSAELAIAGQGRQLVLTASSPAATALLPAIAAFASANSPPV